MAPIQAKSLLTTRSPRLTIQYPSVVDALLPLCSSSTYAEFDVWTRTCAATGLADDREGPRLFEVAARERDETARIWWVRGRDAVGPAEMRLLRLMGGGEGGK